MATRREILPKNRFSPMTFPDIPGLLRLHRPGTIKIVKYLEGCLNIGFILGRLKINVSPMPQMNVWRQTQVDEALNERWAIYITSLPLNVPCNLLYSCQIRFKYHNGSEYFWIWFT